jgi:hypothetical protein
MKSPDQRGLEVPVPRRVAAREILRVRNIPQLMGWRFFPESKNTSTTWLPWKGAIKRRRVLASLDRKEDREVPRQILTACIGCPLWVISCRDG